MFRNYFITAWRTLLRSKMIAFINILGLAIGIACCLLILLYVRYESSFDNFHEKSDRIYRLAVEYQVPGSVFDNALSSAPMGPALLADYGDEVEAAVRFHPAGEQLVANGKEKRFYEKDIFYTDASVFEVFTFPLRAGDQKTALKEPFSLVITESVARKYFGTEEAIGKSLTMDQDKVYTVTGVVADLPANSHLEFDFLASFSSLDVALGEDLQRWTFNPFFTYVLLSQESTEESFNGKITSFLDEHMGEQMASLNWKLRAFLQPLDEVHLYPLENDYASQGDARYLYVFSAIALLILLIACVNFMNLTTARAAKRAHEIGVRKVLGAQRFQLVRQFFGEALLTTGLSTLVAIVLVGALLPVGNDLSGKPLSLEQIGIPTYILSLLGITLLVGLIAGGYGAIVLTAFRPNEILKKGGVASHQGRGALRKALVVFQFCASMILVVGALAVHRQLGYIKNTKLGFDQEQVVIVPVRDSSVRAQYQAMKGRLLQEASVTQVALASSPPGRGTFGTYAERPGSEERPPEIKVMMTDSDYVETMDMDMAAGRYFSKDIPTDLGQSVVLNETAARSFGWDSPEEAVGQELRHFTGEMETATVVGVISDFNILPLHFGIQPLMLLLQPEDSNYFLVRIAPGDTQRSLAHLGEVWADFAPQWPFEYSFLDEELEAAYRSEQRLSQLFAYFTGLAIFIACLGLFGLVSFIAESRSKEIGIRKLLGASVASIVGSLSNDFIKLVFIAILVASPLAWWAMDQWLQDFAYRIDLEWWMFFAAGLTVMTVALLTASFHSVKAALMNPVDSLRSE